MSTTDRFLSDNFAPVTEEVTVTDLAVTGTVPAELDGRLVRIGPNPKVLPAEGEGYHWFTGDGMVHGVRLRGGRAEWYRNRWVQGDQGEVVNTHVIGVGGRTFAAVEAGSQPVEIGYELDTIGTCAFDGTLEGAFTAHTHEDPATGELHGVAYNWAWDHLRHVVVGPDARVRREVRIPVPDGPMVHDCAITESYVVLFDLPVTFSMEAVAEGARLPYRWNPDHPPRIGLLPLDGSPDDVIWFDAPSCYVFHTLNAYDVRNGAGDQVVVDLVRHPRMFATSFDGPDEGGTTLERWTLDVATGVVKTEVLDERSQEFPRCDERLTGRPHRFAYGATFGEGVEHGPAIKHDLAAGTSVIHEYGPGRVTLEPLFVPRSATADEDDGWVMSYVYDATTDRSDVVILDARDFGGDPVATIHLPVRVPFGFHGSWLPDA
jgi:carotenoid cleavage dioxygenase